MSTPQTFLMASLSARETDYEVAQANLAQTCTALRPTSAVGAGSGLSGVVRPWFLHSYTFPSCLPDPGRLAVPTRPVVVGAAPTIPCVSRIRLPPASTGRAETAHKKESFHLLSVKRRLVAHPRVPVHLAGLRAALPRGGDREADGICRRRFDNALAESVWATLTKELLARNTFATRAQARTAIFDYLEAFYNPRRRHSTLGNISPAEFERRASQNAAGPVPA